MIHYLFKQALLQDGWHNNVFVSVNTSGVISEVKKNHIPESGVTTLDCVIPSMPNCHSHVFQRTMAGMTEYKTSENDSFWSWRELMYKYANLIDAQQLYHIACYCYSEMLAAGYSSVCEFHYLHRDLNNPSNTEDMSMAIINAAHDTGISLTLLPVVYQQSHIDGSPLSGLQSRFYLSNDEYIQLYRSLQNKLFPEQNTGICFHSLRAVSIESMKMIFGELNDGQPVHIHISEQIAEVEQVLEHTGKRPVELLYDNFNVNENWCLIHATHLNDNEISLIANSGAVAGICPMTEANLGDGVFPLSSFIKRNGKIAIGSDSHILINPFQEMQILEYSQRLNYQQRVIASTPQYPNTGTLLWNFSVSGGVLSSRQPINGIAQGQKANWIELDTNNPLFTGMKCNQILDSIIFADNKTRVQSYLLGQKLTPIDKNVTKKYKNTLKSLR